MFFITNDVLFMLFVNSEIPWKYEYLIDSSVTEVCIFILGECSFIYRTHLGSSAGRCPVEE